MGNVSSSALGLEGEQALDVRERYKGRVAEAYGVPRSCVHDPLGMASKEEEGEATPDPTANAVLVRVGNAEAEALSAKHGFMVVPHVAVVSHCMAKASGVEMVVRLPAEEEDEATTIKAIRQDLSTWCTMQDNAKFRVWETAQMIVQNFDVAGSGDKGALLARDPLLSGIGGYTEDGMMDESGPNHDDDYVPAHFLAVHPLMPTEYAAVNSIRVRAFAGLIREHWSPIYLSTPHRANHLVSPAFRNALEELQASSPVRHISDGVTVDVRLRKHGTACDILFSGRCMAHLLIPLSKAFGKEKVPLGTEIGLQSDGGHTLAFFRCHDGEGNEITPETAHYRLEQIRYGNTQGDPVEVPEKESLEMVFLPPGEVWKQKQMIRMTVMTFLLPAQMLATMLDSVRTDMPQGASAVGYVREWPEFFKGTHPPCGVLEQLKDKQEGRKCQFRFMCAPMEYFEDEMVLTDDGHFVPPLSTLGYDLHSTAEAAAATAGEGHTKE
mmetsp:Transcript_18145/g.70143  ORF Transcript_18145/g.70143 Transcript_18145/m.70143 type:complete len:495 (-) Transcript_18145:78-1562(-)|eukprot:CAMPEP_0114612594 /NCGR_PEP_ID=MMETSP0168-20121206/4701_1 /TAXON_ID=95228 ORGANISM="Vannella sp., Strain DIVA3 517/6/12" /NCGR_SAMPLE_ID=MMETSP0168 /ASSEMBLY_ACC=CAM_ASM_000044 /LENGTH=494 /DNA_ID=CAMNT_0001823581 /DNA_START=45 /DNA_END=1529 /DNA_ORIENTATION=-